MRLLYELSISSQNTVKKIYKWEEFQKYLHKPAVFPIDEKYNNIELK